MQQKFFIQPFAFAGDKTAIPDALDPSGHVSFNQGYGFDYQRDLTSDPAAKAIERNGMNWLFGAITENLAQYQTSSAPEFITSTDNGGSAYSYARGVSVRYRTGTNPFLTYVSRIAGNTNTPTEGASDANWALLTFEISSSAQATAGTDDTTIMTPLKVKQAITASASTVPAASETVAGIAKIATAAMVAAGTDDTSMVTSLKLAQAVPVASTTTVGKSRLATPAETLAMALTTVAVTPGGLTSLMATKANVSGQTFTGNVNTSGNGVVFRAFDNNADIACVEIGGGNSDPTDRAGYIINRNSGQALVITTVGGNKLTMQGSALTWDGTNFTAGQVTATSGQFTTTADVNISSTGSAKAIYFRPQGPATGGGQMILANSGDLTVSGGVTTARGVNVSAGDLTISNTGPQGINLFLTGDGGTTPKKALRVHAGNLEFVNSAYSSVIATMGDTGSWTMGGSVTATGFQISSSRKIKEITGTIDSALRTVCEIETGRGHYLPSFTEDQRERLFLIAEQLRPLVPEAVIDRHDADENARLGPTIEYTALIPVLIEAIKELADAGRQYRHGIPTIR